ncbi:MAG TPA: trigger factor [Gemmataceae bacterium]|nr:trigger factor [Gemmataceae bacterium]
MADDTTPDTPTGETPNPTETAGGAAAVAAPEGADGQEGPVKLVQTVEISDVGPCKKHVKVTVERKQIDERLDEKYTELVQSDQPQVRGFRPGKAPRKLIERRYHESVTDEVKTQVLMASLEQLAEEQQISPLSPPDLDPNQIEIPEAGPFVYEFDIEVRPEFDLPDYKGLKLRRPVHTFTAAETEREKKRLLERYGQLAPKEGDNPAVELDDYITADVEIKFRDRLLNKLQEVRVKVDKQLALSDGVAENFGKVMIGSKAGDVRTVDITLSQEIGSEVLRGQKVQATFTVQDVKIVRPPELTRDLLEGAFGVSTPEGFDELVTSLLERRLEYTQRQEARKQVLDQIAAAANWELPRDMLQRQARRTLSRRVMEMKNAGMSDAQIQGRRRLLEQDVIQSTAAALKEHFVLQKIAEQEKLEIEDEDIDLEVERIADQSGESPRKVKARLEREDLMEALATDLLERKALDLILASATYEDYQLTPEEQAEHAPDVATMAAPAVPGEEGKPAESAEPPGENAGS